MTFFINEVGAFGYLGLIAVLLRLPFRVSNQKNNDEVFFIPIEVRNNRGFVQ